MPLVETEALILKTYNLADADKIVVFLAKKEGLLRGVAKGAKRLKSKFGSALEPFSIVELGYNQKEERELVLLERIEIKRSFFDSSRDPNFFQRFSYLVDLLMDFAPPHEPNENLYRMASACLAAGSLGTTDTESISFYFEYWILKLGGFLPDWTRCQLCRRDIRADEDAELQTDFGLFCSKCKRAKGAAVIGPGLRALYLSTRDLPPERFAENSSIDRAGISELSSILKKIIARILDREIKHQKPFVPENFHTIR